MFFSRLYDRLIYGLAGLGAASLAAVTALVIYDVASRNLGLPSFSAASALVEYALLLSTMAACPWLVRINGHVSLASLVEQLPRAVQSVIHRIVLAVSSAAMGVLAVVAGQITLHQWQAGIIEVRSVDLPGWVLYAFMAVGFGLMSTEFLRMFLRGEVYTGAEGEH